MGAAQDCCFRVTEPAPARPIRSRNFVAYQSQRDGVHPLLSGDGATQRALGLHGPRPDSADARRVLPPRRRRIASSPYPYRAATRERPDQQFTGNLRRIGERSTEGGAAAPAGRRRSARTGSGTSSAEPGSTRRPLFRDAQHDRTAQEPLVHPARVAAAGRTNGGCRAQTHRNRPARLGVRERRRHAGALRNNSRRGHRGVGLQRRAAARMAAARARSSSRRSPKATACRSSRL
ncbi:hypothetical protein BPA30113_04077 [Burkholderia paludis]|uniref:Uncharacterized protein n=1 Tax=Burkholderia paludis TaxID=1506587 RepID=A0A6J5E3W5_9BURK|nr:hypothetical protein LMG30113_03731 [Burkholderia paludis]VWB88024.1 hypothetical protein BPA30113_04077 [Burkholderia paludis]